MLSILLKNRLQALMASFFRGSRRKKSSSPVGKLGVAVLVVYLIACFFYLFYISFDSMAQPLFGSGLGWLFFALIAIMDLGVCVIFTLFMAQKQLFEATDNDLLLSLPIPPRDILASRMLMLLLLCYFYQLLVLPAAIVVWWRVAMPSLLSLICFCVVFLTLPLLALALCCLLGWLLQLLSSRLPKKNILSMLVSVGFLIAYFYFYSNLQNYIARLIANSESIAATMQAKLPPLFYLGSAVAEGNLLHLLIYLLFALIPFALVYLLLSRSFVRLTTQKRGIRHIKYEARAMKVKSPLRAFVGKELRLFLNSSTYMLNGALGLVFMLIGAVLLLVRRDAVADFVGQLQLANANVVYILVPLLIGMVSGLNIISASSVSLEAKCLWISQSLPVKKGSALLAKVLLQIILVLPVTLLLALILVLQLRFPLFETLAVLAYCALFAVFMAYFGVYINLHFPKLDWVSESMVVKQSTSVLITMLGGIAVGTIPFVAYLLLLIDSMPAAWFICGVSLLLLIAILLMHRYLTGKGAVKYAFLA